MIERYGKIALGLGVVFLVVLAFAYFAGSTGRGTTPVMEMELDQAGVESVVGVAWVIAYAFGLIAAALLVAALVRGVWRSAFRGKYWARGLANAPVTAWFGLITITILVLIGVFADQIAPYGETEVVGRAYIQAGADEAFLLGTDQVGRDILSRIVYGARNTIGIALITTVLTFLLGSIMGMLAATLGGFFDQAISRVVDVLMSIPQLIFALLLLSIFGTGLLQMILVIAVLDSTRVFRLSRAVAQGIVAMDYIEAAKLRGEGLGYLMRREILPNAMAPLVAEFGLRFCYVLLTIAALSFLGLGIQPPTADWASMVAEMKQFITFGIATPLIPGAFIALLTVSMNLVVDWMLHSASGLKD